MTRPPQATSEVLATVTEVWPAMGLVWLDDGEREWAVSRSTPGVHLDQLTPGARVALRVQEFHGKLVPQGLH
jgi:hypothetical protein